MAYATSTGVLSLDGIPLAQLTAGLGVIAYGGNITDPIFLT